MITYVLFNFEGQQCIQKYIDDQFNWAIPTDPANTDYQEYLRWVEEGNEPLLVDSE